MAQPTVTDDALTLTHQQRISACGFPIRLLRASGAVTDGHWSCAHRCCAQCSRSRSQRIWSSVNELLDEHGKPVVLLTLTHRPEPGTTLDDFQRGWQRFAEHWNETYQALKRQDRYQAKLEEWTEILANAHAQGRAGEVAKCERWIEHYQRERFAAIPPLPSALEEYTSTHDDEAGWRTSGDLTLIWAREVTPGKPDPATGQHKHWHVHQHIICPDLATAQRINAAWQHTRTQRQFCRTDIQDSRAEATKAARYVSKYVTKNGADVPEPLQPVLVQGMKHKRLYDAAGDWRPIGVAPEPAADSAIAIGVQWADAGDVFETFEAFYSSAGTLRGVILSSGVEGPGVAVEVDRVNELILEQRTNNSDRLLTEHYRKIGLACLEALQTPPP